METLGVLDREIVQAETLLHFAQLCLVGLEQPQPDKALVLHTDLRGPTQLHRPLLLAAPIAVVGTIDDHGLLPVRWRYNAVDSGAGPYTRNPAALVLRASVTNAGGSAWPPSPASPPFRQPGFRTLLLRN